MFNRSEARRTEVVVAEGKVKAWSTRMRRRAQAPFAMCPPVHMSDFEASFYGSEMWCQKVVSAVPSVTFFSNSKTSGWNR